MSRPTSAHLAPEEESSALVGCVPQPPTQASISISTSTATHHRILPVQIIIFVVIEEHCVQHILHDPGHNSCLSIS